MNKLLLTDSYKVSHHKQYPPGTKRVFSFFESRGGLYPDTTFFGLQYILQKYLVGKFVTQEDIEDAAHFFADHFGDATLFNRAGWEYILNTYDGKLPVRIKAVPEGTTVPNHNVLMTIENTDDNVPWLTNYLETLLCQVWYPSTVCTQSREMKKTIKSFLERTGDPSGLSFKLHDFGFRGSTSVESAGIGGAAHLVNFLGTDTLEGAVVAQKYYGAAMPGFSIPAAEHSTITSWGREHEADAYRNMLLSYPKGLVAVVSDSYNIYEACNQLWGNELKNLVETRDGVLVIRPDSGDPDIVVVNVLHILERAFGATKNSKGYKVLNPKVRVIQGDGIDADMLAKVLAAMKSYSWSADNIAFGSGGGLLQKVNRDTQKFAFKCSAVKVGNEWRNVMKQPVTDPGKTSKAGRLYLSLNDGMYSTRVAPYNSDYPGENNQLVTVFENGSLFNVQTFDDIRKRAELEHSTTV